jgi:hypothetical protein
MINVLSSSKEDTSEDCVPIHTQLLDKAAYYTQDTQQFVLDNNNNTHLAAFA